MPVSAETRDSVARALRIAVEDSNGDHVYSNMKAMAGYLSPSKFLLVPAALDSIKDTLLNLNVDIKALGKVDGITNYLGAPAAAYCSANPYLIKSTSNNTVIDVDLTMMKVTAANYVALCKDQIDSPSAFVAAACRGRWCITGAYAALVNDNAKLTSEVRVFDNTDPVYGGISSAVDMEGVIAALDQENYGEAFAKEFISTVHGMEWVVKHADNIWAAVEHTFRVRGHHFRDSGAERESYVGMYERYLTACFEGNFLWPTTVDMFHVFHTAIHPFRVKALAVVVAHYAAHGTLANSAVLRFSGAPVGNAIITTAVAALSTMSGEAWYNAFVKAYGTQIALLDAFSSQILDNKYGFHNSASLYGLTKVVKFEVDGKDYSLEKAKQITASVAAACQGLVQALTEVKAQNLISSFALSNARALVKSADQSPLISLRVRELVIKAVDLVTTSSDIPKAIANALPELEIASAKQAPTG